MENNIYNQARFGRGLVETPTVETAREAQEAVDTMIENYLNNAVSYYRALEKRRNEILLALKMVEENSSLIIGTLNKETYESELLHVEREIRRVSTRFSKLKSFNIFSYVERDHHNLL